MTCQSSGRSPTIAIGFGPFVTPSRIRIPRPPQNNTTFTTHTSDSDDLERGNGEHQPPAPRADELELPADLLPQVPRQDNDVVRPGRGQSLGVVDRDVRAREELALLERAAINGVLEEVRSDATVVEQRVALARGPVARDRFALR